MSTTTGASGAGTHGASELAQARTIAAELAASAAAASAAGASALARARAKTSAKTTPARTKAATTAATPRSTAAARAIRIPAKGYATAPAKTTKTTASTAKAATSTSKYTADYAFLSDKSLSAQEKLVLFLAAQKKNANKELESMLDKAAAQKAEAKKGSSLFDVAKSVVSPLGFADSLLGGKLEGLLKQVSGPMLGAAATALGMPALAPIAMSVGPQLLGSVLDATVPGSSSSSSSGGSKGGELDDVELARVQMLQKRVEEWTGMISNLMQSFHQSRMNVVNNLR